MSEITGTKAAFIIMLQERGVYNKLGVDRSTVSNWKRALHGIDDRNKPTVEKMEEMLLKAGAHVLSEKVWDLPG